MPTHNLKISYFIRKHNALKTNTYSIVHYALFMIWSLCCCSSFSLSAQEQLGIRLDNYGGINTVLLNPANGTQSPFLWDINLAKAAVFVSNNYVFIENKNVFDILQSLPQLEAVLRSDMEEATDLTAETLVIDFFDNQRKRYFATAIGVMGPSALVQLPNQQSLGLFTRFRTAFLAQSVSTTLSYYTYYNRPFEETFSIFPFQGTAMSWTELGLHYGKNFDTYDGKVGIALNARLLQGHEAVYFQNDSRIRYTKFPGDTISTNKVDVRFGWTNSNTESDSFNLERNGSGFAVDLGFNYLLGTYNDTYRWKIGLSLIDIGYIRFNKNAQQHQAQRDSLIFYAFEDYETFTEVSDIDELVALFSEQTLGDSEASFVADQFSVLLPAAFSLQLDFAFAKNLYLNATAIQRLNFQKASLHRGNLLALTPRFESRWISAALPLVVYNMNHFRIGAAVRLAFLTLGTEHLGSLFTRSNLSGTDFYVALKINPFKTNFGGKGQKRNKNKVKCPAITTKKR